MQKTSSANCCTDHRSICMAVDFKFLTLSNIKHEEEGKTCTSQCFYY